MMPLLYLFQCIGNMTANFSNKVDHLFGIYNKVLTVSWTDEVGVYVLNIGLYRNNENVSIFHDKLVWATNTLLYFSNGIVI